MPFGKPLHGFELDERLGLLARWEETRDDDLEPGPRRIRGAAAVEVTNGTPDLIARRQVVFVEAASFEEILEAPGLGAPRVTGARRNRLDERTRRVPAHG